MHRPETVGAINQTSDSGSGDDYGLDFIRSVGGRQPIIHKVWIFGDDGITTEVHPTARVDVGNFVGSFCDRLPY